MSQVQILPSRFIHSSLEDSMTTATFKLSGDSLLKHNAEWMELVQRGEKTRTDMILDAGYVYDSGKAMYTEYYTELLAAKGVVPATTTDVEDDEYDNLSTDEKDLYDSITDLLGEKWTHEETIEFMDELDDIGIETASQFEDAYEYTHDSWAAFAEKEFAEYFCVEVMNAQIPEMVYSAVDWQDVWDHNLRYDYNSIETVNGTFFFRNN
jgi:hypothetical protein